MTTSSRRRAGRFSGHGPIAIAGFRQAQFADVAGQRDLRRRNSDSLQLPGKFLLGVDFLAANDLQDLALAKILIHTCESLTGKSAIEREIDPS